MSLRPEIPAEVARHILIESGHRCAVCGAGCPLERAHIIPWRRSRDHSAANLICLCANCHERADGEEWGEAALREYKDHPWVLRQFERTAKSAEPKSRIRLTVALDAIGHEESQQRVLQYAIAAFLDIAPDRVRIIQVTRDNSVTLILELPAQAAGRLLRAFESGDSLLLEYLGPFGPLRMASAADIASPLGPGLNMPRVLRLPRISEIQIEASVVGIPVRPGDYLTWNQPYLEIDTDKATIELPTPYDCVVLNVHVNVGDKVQQDSELITVEPRDNLQLCAIREQRAHVSTGLTYLTTRTARGICRRDSHGRYGFVDVEPFIETAIGLAHTLKATRLDATDDADIVELRDTLYHVTQQATRIESFGSRGPATVADYAYILRAVSDYQEPLIRRLLRAVGRITGTEHDETQDIRRAAAVYNAGRAYVFISHHHTDSHLALELAAQLETAGVANFVDDLGIPWGEPIPGVIHTALARASHILVIMTPGSVRSAWVAYEVGFARGAGKTIVPYLQHPEMELPGFMNHLRQLRTPSHMEKFIEGLQQFRRAPPPHIGPSPDERPNTQMEPMRL